MKAYHDMIETVLGAGNFKAGRNGGTRSFFSYHWEHDLRNGFPLLTTKRMFWRGIVHEFLWYLSGSPHIRDMQEQGLTFWDEWADDRGYVPSPYGWFWRRWGGSRMDGPHDASIHPPIAHWEEYGDSHIDQLQLILDELRTNPMSRRLVLTAWDPVNAWASSLPPCHAFFVLNVQPEGDALFLNGHLTQRSADLALGVPFNVAHYSMLIHLLAHLAGMQVGTFAHTMIDCHIYEDHIPGLERQLTREPRELPSLDIAGEVSSLDGLQPSDFILTGYDPHPPIKFEVSP